MPILRTLTTGLMILIFINPALATMDNRKFYIQPDRQVTIFETQITKTVKVIYPGYEHFPPGRTEPTKYDDLVLVKFLSTEAGNPPELILPLKYLQET